MCRGGSHEIRIGDDKFASAGLHGDCVRPRPRRRYRRRMKGTRRMSRAMESGCDHNRIFQRAKRMEICRVGSKLWSLSLPEA